MVNKKGYIKTLEAVIAIIMIITVSYTLIPKSMEKPPEPPLIVQDSMKFVNQKIETDEYTREKIVPYEGGINTWVSDEENPFSRLTSFVNQSVPIALYDFSCAVCSSPSLCIINTPINRNVYTTDVFIASGGGERNPKLVRVWLWEKLTGTEETEFKTSNPQSYLKCCNCIKSNKNKKSCTEGCEY